MLFYRTNYFPMLPDPGEQISPFCGRRKTHLRGVPVTGQTNPVGIDTSGGTK